MSSFDRTSLKKWMAPVAAALALAGLLAALSTAVLGAFDGGAQAPEVIHRTARPFTSTRTPTITLTPSVTLTPSETPTPTFTLTPSQTPTPFPPKNPAELGNTVIIGGSTGSGFLATNALNYVAVFDGSHASGNGPAAFAQVGHVILPGAITHLSVKLDQNVAGIDGFEFSFSVNQQKSSVACAIPSKGKGDFCESGDKVGDCLEVGPQDMVAVQAVPIGIIGGQPAGSVPVRMSWVAKLEMYGECPAPYVGLNSCQAFASCFNVTGHIGNNSCDTPGGCNNTSADVGDGSCNGGEFACNANTGDIGDGSCNNYFACTSSDSAIGDGSCNGEQSCAGSSSQVGNNSCNGYGACYNNSGDVGNNACNGALACKDNTAPIADNTCNTDNACQGP